MLGKAIWNTAYPDLYRVNEILDFVANYNYYLTIDDSANNETDNETESEAERYYVEGEVFSFGKKLHVYNVQFS